MSKDIRLKTDYSRFIDHTNLKPNAIDKDIYDLCREAIEYKFRGVCVFPSYVRLAAGYKQHWYADFEISAVIGFPCGCTSKDVKVKEALLAVRDGATELDFVWNQADFANSNYLAVLKDIAAVVQIGVPVKVIVEECNLSEESVLRAHQIVSDSGAFCIKTSTGWGPGNATFKTVKTWRHLGGIKIKASGGIRDRMTAEGFIASGADIIGTSSGVAICRS